MMSLQPIDLTGHVGELLPDYVNHRLGAPEVDRVVLHLAECAACATELHTWQQIAGAVQLAGAAVAAPSPAVLHRIRAALDGTAGAVSEAPPSTPAPWAQRARVLWAQTKILPISVWIASALAIALATAYALALQIEEGRLIVGFALPLVAAIGMAFLYGPEVDSALEIALATPTSRRQLLLSRWSLLFGYDLLLSLGATLILATVHGTGLWSIAQLWMGPMALLSALSALASLLLGPTTAVATGATVWLMRLIQVEDGFSLRLVDAPFWHTSPAMLVLAGALFALALVVVEHQEQGLA